MNQIDISKVIAVLHRGGIISHPTEAVFSLGCDPFNEKAVLQILELKQRPVAKGLILIGYDWKQLQDLTLPISDERLNAVKKTWPGPYTWIFPASAKVPYWIRGNYTTIAVRVTAHPIAKLLCREFGLPLVTTSANLAGQPPARSSAEVHKIFADKIDYVVDGAVGGLTNPTEIRDAVSGNLVRS